MALMHKQLVGVFAAVLAIAAPIAASAQDEWRFSGVERIVAVADIHGAYPAFETILRQSGVVDESLAWAGGATHLVIVGDILDRGAQSRRAMDLLMRLEPEARAQGGRVDVVLGNHEIMNMVGILDYVSPGEYAAFAADETAADRAAGLAGYAAARPDVDEGAVAAEFDARYPPGFFAHREAFSADGQYGAWLLEHPFLVVIDDWGFVHGGLTGAVSEAGPETNERLAAELTGYMEALETLTAAGVIGGVDLYDDHVTALDRFAARVATGEAAWPEGAESAARRLRALTDASALVGGPTWYRGNVGCSRLIEEDRLEAALTALGAERLVVGHTPTTDGRVRTRMEGLLTRIDTGMLSEYYGGRASALVIEGGRVVALYENEPSAGSPLPDRTDPGPLEAFLAEAAVVSREPVDATTSRVRLERDGMTLDALFVRAERANVRPDVAAYRLDRLLGLDMVPVTVARELDGEPGSLQHIPPRLITEPERSAARQGASAWCPLGDQLQAMYVFDTLIYNEGRTAERITYDTYNFDLVLVGHESAFSTDRGRPRHLAELDLAVTPAWGDALAAFDEASLTAALGDVLDRRRIRALLFRRDELLEELDDD